MLAKLRPNVDFNFNEATDTEHLVREKTSVLKKAGLKDLLQKRIGR